MQGACKPKVILLDFDGTIVDTMDEYARLAADIITAETRLPRDEVEKRYRETAGMAFRDQLRLLGLDDGTIEGIASKFEAAKRRLLSRLRVSENVEWFVKQARARGLKVYVSTNNECNVVNSNAALLKPFDGVLCYDPERGLKKGEGHIGFLERVLGVRRCEIVFIGDSRYDVELHRSLGVRILVTRGLWLDAERVLHSLDRILNDP
ncbi:MAG: HAD hydrolase-like protein [Desulfurococcales archaeon]|nr:HAD hydrolase-like protein [Desulfurococcales archaeon]